jgi:hypothetical protein
VFVTMCVVRVRPSVRSPWTEDTEALGRSTRFRVLSRVTSWPRRCTGSSFGRHRPPHALERPAAPRPAAVNPATHTCAALTWAFMFRGETAPAPPAAAASTCLQAADAGWPRGLGGSWGCLWRCWGPVCLLVTRCRLWSAGGCRVLRARFGRGQQCGWLLVIIIPQTGDHTDESRPGARRST